MERWGWSAKQQSKVSKLALLKENTVIISWSMCECRCWLNAAGWVQIKQGNKNTTVSIQCIINHREQLTKHHLSTSGLILQPQSYVNDRLESFMTAFFI